MYVWQIETQEKQNSVSPTFVIKKLNSLAINKFNYQLIVIHLNISCWNLLKKMTIFMVDSLNFHFFLSSTKIVLTQMWWENVESINHHVSLALVFEFMKLYSQFDLCEFFFCFLFFVFFCLLSDILIFLFTIFIGLSSHRHHYKRQYKLSICKKN